MIVLNEIDWARDVLQSNSLGNKPYETFCRVAKYYVHDGYTKQKIRKKLEDFLLRCDPKASIPKWSNTIDYAIKYALKHPAVEIDGISITKSELEKINAISGKQIRRLAFTLLCLAKYYDVVNPNGDHWVNSEDNEIMRMANISTSIRRQSDMFHQLWKLGLIQFSKKIDNTNVRVLFIDDSDDVEMTITDFRNLGYQYLMYKGDPFFICENCGIVTKIKNPDVGRRQKYCPSCAKEIQLQQIMSSVMRKRKLAKLEGV